MAAERPAAAQEAAAAVEEAVLSRLFWGDRKHHLSLMSNTLGRIIGHIEKMKAKIAAHAGEAAARMIHAALAFEVTETRPLADFGQGWEKSI
jgi:hypothetical protein